MVPDHQTSGGSLKRSLGMVLPSASYAPKPEENACYPEFIQVNKNWFNSHKVG